MFGRSKHPTSLVGRNTGKEKQQKLKSPVKSLDVHTNFIVMFKKLPVNVDSPIY